MQCINLSQIDFWFPICPAGLLLCTEDDWAQAQQFILHNKFMAGLPCLTGAKAGGSSGAACACRHRWPSILHARKMTVHCSVWTVVERSVVDNKGDRHRRGSKCRCQVWCLFKSTVQIPSQPLHVPGCHNMRLRHLGKKSGLWMWVNNWCQWSMKHSRMTKVGLGGTRIRANNTDQLEICQIFRVITNIQKHLPALETPPGPGPGAVKQGENCRTFYANVRWSPGPAPGVVTYRLCSGNQPELEACTISKVPIANPCENQWFSHLRILGEWLRKSICESLRILAKACETMNCESLRKLAKHCETIFANLRESLRKPAKSYLRKLAKP